MFWFKTNNILTQFGFRAKQFSSDATEWGKKNEISCTYVRSIKYTKTTLDMMDFTMLHLDIRNPSLFRSITRCDPSECNPFGLADVKCPFSLRHQTSHEAAKLKAFCCQLVADIGGSQGLQLKCNHPYFLTSIRTNGYHRKTILLCTLRRDYTLRGFILIVLSEMTVFFQN